MIYVSCYYADAVTAIDFMSRLGNFKSLKDFSHYFCGFSENVRGYLETLTGVVQDNDLSEIWVFVSDIFCKSPNYMNFTILKEISELQTIYVSSDDPIAEKAIDWLNPGQIASLHDFMKTQHGNPFKVFVVNSGAYVFSEVILSQGHNSRQYENEEVSMVMKRDNLSQIIL